MRFSVPSGETSLVVRLLVTVAACVFCLECGRAPTQPSPGTPPPVPGPSPTPTVPSPGPAVFAGAGDIAIEGGHDADTARLLEQIGGDVFTLGDNAYPNGSAENFQVFDRTWGRFKGPRMHPAPGNHEYNTPAAASYFQYFGDQIAGPSGRGYYSFDLGSWHILSLNSNFDFGVGVDAGSAQAAFVQGDLAAHASSKCTLAYWHHPLYSSGRGGDNLRMRPIFQLLYDNNADVVLAGHDHTYERFGPQAPDGRPDPSRGIRMFNVGTGGVPLYEFHTTKANSEQRIADSWGVLKLTLLAESYQWEYVTTANGGAVRDSGAGQCH